MSPECPNHFFVPSRESIPPQTTVTVSNSKCLEEEEVERERLAKAKSLEHEISGQTCRVGARASRSRTGKSIG